MSDMYIRFCRQCGIPPVRLSSHEFLKVLEVTIEEERTRWAGPGRRKMSYAKEAEEATDLLIIWYDNARDLHCLLEWDDLLKHFCGYRYGGFWALLLQRTIEGGVGRAAPNASK